MKNLLILISAFAFAACQQNAPTNQTAKPVSTVSANVLPNNSVSAIVLPTAAPGVSALDKTKIKNSTAKAGSRKSTLNSFRSNSTTRKSKA